MWRTIIMPIALGVVSGLLTTAILYYIPKWNNKRRINRSEYSGYWKTDIYEKIDTDYKLIKTDYLLIKHDWKTGEFKGEIKRALPQEQRHREWFCRGVFIKDVMLVVFWSKKNILSFGVEYLVMVNDFEYSGYYLKDDRTKTAVFPNILPAKLINTKLVKEEDIKDAKAVLK